MKRYRTSEETYKKAYEACKGMCVLCGVRVGLELHHIFGRGKYLTDQLPNCVFLCHNCHDKVVHGNLKKYRPILKRISEKIYHIKIYDGPQKG